MTEKLEVEVIPVTSVKDVFAGVDIALCATGNIEHVFFKEFIEEDMHIGSIKIPEVDEAVLNRADRLGVHSNYSTADQVVSDNYEEFKRKHGTGSHGVSEPDFSDALPLPAMIAGEVTGREDDQEVTCFLNNLGISFQFAVMGFLVYRKAKAANIDNELPTDWFTEDVHP